MKIEEASNYLTKLIDEEYEKNHSNYTKFMDYWDFWAHRNNKDEHYSFIQRRVRLYKK